MKTEEQKTKEWADKSAKECYKLRDILEDAIPKQTHSAVVIFAAQMLLSEAIAQAATSKNAARIILSDIWGLLKKDTREWCELLKKPRG